MTPTEPPAFLPLYRSILQLAAGHPATIALDALSAVTAELIFEYAEANGRALIHQQFDARVKFLVGQLAAARRGITNAPSLSIIRPN